MKPRIEGNKICAEFASVDRGRGRGAGRPCSLSSSGHVDSTGLDRAWQVWLPQLPDLGQVRERMCKCGGVGWRGLPVSWQSPRPSAGAALH